MSENNTKGLCAECGNQLGGQTYSIVDWGNGNDDEPLFTYICQACELKRIDKKIQDEEFKIGLSQTLIKDLKKRRAKVEKNESEFS